jgi:hypothetical protein
MGVDYLLQWWWEMNELINTSSLTVVAAASGNSIKMQNPSISLWGIHLLVLKVNRPIQKDLDRPSHEWKPQIFPYINSKTSHPTTLQIV